MNVEKLSPREFERFRGFIYEQSGIRIGDGKVSLLSNRIRRRLKACGFSDFDTYYGYLTSKKTDSELDFFLDAVTTNETFFFRTPAHFQWLKTTFLPAVLREHQRGQRQPSLRFWSAACANGAEPYSIAVCLTENRFRMRDWKISILATDISERELADARDAVFKSRSMDAVTPQQTRRFFRQQSDDTWQLKDEIREMVRFTRHNLMQPIEQPPFDCIFLCNVLIYFDENSKQTVVEHLANALTKGGFLVTGPSEGLFDVPQQMKKHSACIYQKT